MRAILIITLLVASAFAYSAQYEELNFLWSTWKNLHNKQYSAGEEAARYAIFLDNYNKIIKHNAEHSNLKLRLNLFADLTAAEFKHKHSGCAFAEDNEDYIKQNTVKFEGLTSPSSVDWRQKNAVTPVKDQGQCGSCWTFSTTGALEGFYAINKGSLLSFSEQQIVDCSTSSGQGCSGGYPYIALHYAAQLGIETESDYPYTAENGQCNYNKNKAIKVNTRYSFVTNYNTDALKSAIANGPVSVLIEADQEVFQFYSSGVVGPNDGCGSSLDHAVLAVGYGSFDGSDAFIIKNSWGESWGQSGYIYLSTDSSANGGAGVCGVLSQPVVPK